MKIGFIGLGTMGRPMALNLAQRGHAVGIYSRRRESAEPLLSAGASLFRSPAELASHCDVVFTMVTATADVEQIVLGDKGIIEGASAGFLFIDMSTIAPVATRRIAERLFERGVDMLDAPVSGGPEGARDATLTIMVGGKRHVFERAKPLLDCLGSTVAWMGDHGAGHMTKVCNQLLLLVTAQGVAEALTLARAWGLDAGAVQRTLMGGLASSRVLDRFGSRMAARDFTAGLETRLYHKDMGMALELGAQLGVATPAAALVMQCINVVMGQGRHGDDLSVLITVTEAMTAQGDASQRDWHEPSLRSQPTRAEE
jgi:2-hydroxy-3-oxopropionate reductase